MIANEPSVAIPMPGLSDVSPAQPWEPDQSGNGQVGSPFAALPFPEDSHVLSTVAHELRGPLTALVSSSELLAEDFDTLRPDQMLDMAAAMHRGALWLHAW